MKRNLTKLLLLLVVLVVSVGYVKAQSWTSGAPLPDEEGEYYLYNIGGDRFINRGSSWTTHAIADGQGFVVTLTKKSDGVYSIYTGIANGGGGKYLSGEWVDSGETPLTFASVEVAGYTNAFTITSDNKYLSFVNGSGGYGSEILFKDAIQDGNLSYWLIIPKATREDFSSATKDNPLDVTWLIKNPDFDYQVSNNNNDVAAAGWEQSTLKDWTHDGYWRQNSEQSFAKGNFAEKWSGNGFSDTHKIHQSPTLPEGVYKLSCGGTARYDKFYLYAANRSTHITSAGTYDVFFEMESEGACELGARIEPGGTGDWAALDNVRLSYYGTATTLAAVIGIDEAVLEAKYAEADQTKLMNAETKSALVNAYNTAKASLTVDNYEALVATVDAAKASISEYEQIGNRIWIANTFMYNGLTSFDASSVSTKYNGGQYANDYNPDEIYREYAQLYNAQTVATPGTDYTLGIVNPTFETGNTFGWTHGSSVDTGVKENSNPTYTMTNCDRDHLFNTWYKGVPLTQTIENIPNGIYRLTVTVASGDDDKDAYIYATANGSREVVKCPQGTKGTGRDVSVTTVVSSGTITIGTIGGNDDGSYNEEGHWWYKADNFRLTYLQSIDDYIAPLKAKLTADAQDGFVEAANTALSLEDIDAAYKAAVRQQATVGANYTDIIVNPSFETGDTQGWTHGSSGDTGAKKYNMSGKDGDYIFNTWDNWVGASISQTVNDLQNGLYTLKALVASSNNNTVLITANGNNQEVACTGDDNGIEGELTFAVTDGKAIIGAEGKNNCWYKVDNYRLEYAGTITEPTSISELTATTGAVNFKMSALQVLNAGEDSIVVQDITGDAPMGIVIKGTQNIVGAAAAEYGKTISGHVYGTYDAATHYFTLENNTGDIITISNGEATATTIELVDAASTANAYEFVTIEMAEVVQEGEDFYAKKNADKIKIDKRLCPALMLYDGEMQNTITGVTFVEGANCVLAPMSQSDLRSNKAEAGVGEGFAQTKSVNTVNGVIMTYGGNDPEGAEYEFVAVDPSVNRLGTKTTGINTFPVDDKGKAYDPEQKNLPTKGTYYVFTPTKDGQLDVTVDLEQGKKLYVTEDGEALKDFNGITTVTNNMLSFPVEAMKTYYIFANESNLTYYGFSFGLKDSYAKNAVKDIATFKLLPQDNEDGDTLLLKDAIVTYIKGDNVFVEDASGAIVFYQTGIQYYVGQKLNGFIVGKNSFIADNNKMPALKRTANTNYKTFKVTENVTPEAQVIDAIDAQKQTSLARFVKLIDVRAKKDDVGFRVFVDNQGKGNSIRFEDRFNVFFELPEVIGSVQGIVGINSDGVQIFWPTSKDVPVGVGLTEAEESLLAEAQKLAEDREAVAVGLLDDAIAEALTGVGTGLKAAIDLFKANNADQEKDETAKVATDGWKKFDGSAADLAPDWATAAVTTFDGRSSRPAEVYEQGEDAANRTGSIIYQDITGLTNGNYKVGFYGTAYFTPGRGFDSPMQDNATDVAYVFANNEKKFLTSHIGTSFTEASLIQFDVEVTDGNIRLGLGKEKAGTNWHTTQIYQLTWFATAKQRYAAAKASMQELITQAEELAADAEKTTGKEELNAALEAAKAAQESIRLNIPEFETEIGKLSAAINTFNAPYLLLAEAQKLAEDRDAVAVGLLDDAIAEAQANNLSDTADLQEAIDQFKANNANNAKETYAADKASMQSLISQAEELAADETHVNNKEELNTAIAAAKVALANNKLTVPEFEAEIGNMRQAITDFKEANFMGENTLASGKYVLKNVASGLYWGAGNNWGTRASLLDYSEYQTLTMKPDGKYNMESQVSNGGTKYFFNQDGKNLYMDNDNPTALTITPVEVEVEGTEEIIDFDASLYHKWSEVSGTATDNGSANGGVRLNQEVALGDALWGNLSGAVPYKDYANITDYKELRIEGTPGAVIRLMCNRVTDEGPIYEIKPTIPENGKLTIKISDLMFLNGGKPCDFVALQSIKIPAGWQGGTTAATITSMKLVKDGEAKKKVLYTVANGNDYFGYAEEDPNDKPYSASTAILRNGLTADNENALWEIVPATSEALAAATEDKPMDATFLILNPNFGRNNRNSNAWTMVAGNKNLCGGTNENKCAESWRSEFTLSQEIEVANGVYALTAQAALSDYAHLYDGANYPVVYANNVTAPFNNMEGADRESNMDRLSASFAAGNYKVGPLFVEVTDGKLTVGVKGTRTDTWCIWDNFQLTYYGANANIDNISGGAELKELKELREKATELMSDEDIEIAVVKNGLNNALSQTANVSGKDAIKAAIALLKEAIDPAEASKTAKNMLPKMKELIDATNVYTQEAYDQYYGTWLAKYEAGTLTKTEANALQDPTVGTGWHAQITVDNFLLSAWDTNPDFNNAAYYINSWSVEGDKDGTNFRVPFFEYFHDDGTTLGEKTLTATMNGLEPGEYTVSAWARVRVKDASQTSAYGITIQANDGTAVDVCNGDQTERFFLKEVSATGTVGDDGVLKIMFNVAADNNIHWLSFKNVKFEKAEPVEELDPDLIEIAQNQGKDLDTFTRTDLEEGDKYNTYTAHGDLNIAFKMMNIDVTDCDYVIIKFAEPVAAGWHLAFWSNQDLVDVPAGATEFKYVFAEDPKCGIQNGILPQICMMTFFGGFEAPLTAKVTGIYKHRNPSTKIDGMNNSAADDGAIYNLRGQKVENTQKKGLYIKNGKKVMIK